MRTMIGMVSAVVLAIAVSGPAWANGRGESAGGDRGPNARGATTVKRVDVQGTGNHCGSGEVMVEIPVIIVRDGTPLPSLPKGGDVQEDQVCVGIPGSQERVCQDAPNRYCWPWVDSDGKRQCY